MYLNFILQQNGSNPLLSFAPIVLIFGIFYFLLFRPMQQQKKNTQKMLTELANGQSVVTNGGIVGTIVSMNSSDDTLIIRVKPDNIKLQVARSAVAGLAKEESKS